MAAVGVGQMDVSIKQAEQGNERVMHTPDPDLMLLIYYIVHCHSLPTWVLPAPLRNEGWYLVVADEPGRNGTEHKQTGNKQRKPQL